MKGFPQQKKIILWGVSYHLNVHNMYKLYIMMAEMIIIFVLSGCVFWVCWRWWSAGAHWVWNWLSPRWVSPWQHYSTQRQGSIILMLPLMIFPAQYWIISVELPKAASNSLSLISSLFSTVIPYYCFEGEISCHFFFVDVL